MSARRALFLDEKPLKGILTPTPPSAAVAATPAGSVASNSPAAYGSRSGTKKIIDGAKLENPFDHRSSDYHTSQQAALNFELRSRVEKVSTEWEKVVQNTRQQLEKLPEKSTSMNFMTYNGMCSYDEGYGCTEDLPMAEDRLVREFRLLCTVDMLKELQTHPGLNVGSIGSALDTLLSSNRAIQNLEDAVVDIKPLDIAADVEASVASAALHEKLHYNVGEKIRLELVKHMTPMLELEEKVTAAKSLKEVALENRDVAQAAECLLHQVEVSNDLLKLNHVRMSMVQMVADEVEDFDRSARALLDTVHQVSETMQTNLRNIMEPIQRDVADCKKDKELTQQQIMASAAAFANEQTESRLKFKDFEQKEQRLWKQICDLFTELEMTVSDKKSFVWQRLLAKEKHARQQLIEKELLKTQEDHLLRLQICEDYIASAQHGAQQFEAFVLSSDVALKNRVQKHYDDLHALQLRESTDYVRRFEIFAFGAEEVRAKKQSRLDIMDLSRRNFLLDIDAAERTLDPNVLKYKEQLREIEAEHESITQYLGYLNEMQGQRKAEVEPATKLVSAYLVQQKMSSRGRPSATPASGRITSATVTSVTASTPMIGRTVSSAGGSVVVVDHSAEELRPTSGLGDVSVEDTDLPVVEGDELVHPQVAARHLGLIHEENVTLRACDYVREELAAIESRMSDIRRAKSENLQRIESTAAKSAKQHEETPLIFIPKM